MGPMPAEQAAASAASCAAPGPAAATAAAPGATASGTEAASPPRKRQRASLPEVAGPEPSPSPPAVAAGRATGATAGGRAGAGADGSRPPVASVTAVASADLPVHACREEIVEAVRNNRVVVIVGETGSGKTTQIPQYLHNAGLAGRRGVIAVTQPRRIAAMSVAGRVAAEMGCEVGGLVGFHVRFHNRTSGETRLKYMTDGMLVRECAGPFGLKGCGVVVLDEAHERSVDTDVLLGLVKRALEAREPAGLRVVVMSATLSTAKFVDFFGGTDAVRLLNVPGRQHPVSIFYTPSPEPDFLEAALVTAVQLHVTKPPGDVLIFLPGQEDIDGLQRLLEEKREVLAEYRRRRVLREAGPNSGDAADGTEPPQKPRPAAAEALPVEQLEKADDLVVRPIFAALPFDQQQLVFEPAPPGCRKIVLATNIAETSITIPGIRYVVDSGFMKLKICHPQTGVEVLQQVETSQASARQRAGRAGREAPGEAYRLYMEAEHEKMPPQTPAEILRCDLASVYLQLKSLGIEKVSTFPLVERPPQDALVKAAHFLCRIGALDRADSITDIGKKLAMLPVHPLYAYCLLVAIEFECTAEMLSIVAMLSTETPAFLAPSRRQKERGPKVQSVCHEDGDHLSLLSAYSQWNKSSNKQGFARQHGINPTALDRASTIRGQLKELVQQVWGVKQIASCGGPKNYVTVRRALLKGCFMNTARRDDMNQNAYLTLMTRQVAKLHPQSALFQRKPLPPCVVYAELVTTNKSYLRTVTEVDPAWLAELCPRYFASSFGAAAGMPKA